MYIREFLFCIALPPLSEKMSLSFFFFNKLTRLPETFQNWKFTKLKPTNSLPSKEKHRYSAYQETFTSSSEQALFSGFRMVGLTSRAAFTLITGLALQRKHPLEEHSTPCLTVLPSIKSCNIHKHTIFSETTRKTNNHWPDEAFLCPFISISHNMGNV